MIQSCEGGEPPLHHVPQDRRTFAMEGLNQLFQLGLHLFIKASLVTSAVATPARLRLRW